jgi:hypothetical protein
MTNRNENEMTDDRDRLQQLSEIVLEGPVHGYVTVFLNFEM